MQTMAKRIAIESKVREIIAEATGNEKLVDILKNDDLLFSGRTGLDSVDMVSVIILVERNFETNFSQKAELPVLFRTIDSIVDTILLYQRN